MYEEYAKLLNNDIESDSQETVQQPVQDVREPVKEVEQRQQPIIDDYDSESDDEESIAPPVRPAPPPPKPKRYIRKRPLPKMMTREERLEMIKVRSKIERLFNDPYTSQYLEDYDIEYASQQENIEDLKDYYDELLFTLSSRRNEGSYEKMAFTALEGLENFTNSYLGVQSAGLADSMKNSNVFMTSLHELAIRHSDVAYVPAERTMVMEVLTTLLQLDGTNKTLQREAIRSFDYKKKVDAQKFSDL